MRNLLVAAAALASITTTANADQVWLTMDYVRPYKLEKPAHNIIIGNPSIADVTVQDAQNLLLFGKAPGMTNIYIMDEQGNTIDNMIVRVRTNASDMLTYYRGPLRTTYNCTTNCEPTITVGDDPIIFGAVSGQVGQKAGQAAEAANSARDGN